MSISRPLRRRNSPFQEKTFWLHFQVCHDGLAPPPSPSSPPCLQKTNSPTNIPTAFPLFPNLPTELRLSIWSHLLQPRIIIAACFESDPDATTRKHAQLLQRANLPRCPVLLHICAETRALALAHYELTFSWRVPGILAAPCSAPPRVWFNFATDTLLLLGELEPYDSSNINAPMVYFLSRTDAHRVRHVACAFEELRLGEVESEQIFGCLFHILDGFPGAERLLITSTDEDLARAKAGRGGMPLEFGLGMRENIVQKIWWGWINGTSVVTSRMRDKQILMVREDGLADLVAEQAVV